MWISLTGSDPFLTAFKLSKDLKSSAKQEDEFEKDYLSLSLQCSQFALGLLDECKSSNEQTTVLNFPGSDASEDEFWEEALGLVHSAIAYGQKEVRKNFYIIRLALTEFDLTGLLAKTEEVIFSFQRILLFIQNVFYLCFI